MDARAAEDSGDGGDGGGGGRGGGGSESSGKRKPFDLCPALPADGFLQIIDIETFSTPPPTVRRDASVEDRCNAQDRADDEAAENPFLQSVVVLRCKDSEGHDYCLQVEQATWFYLRLSMKTRKSDLRKLKQYFGASDIKLKHMTPLVGYTPHRPGSRLDRHETIPHLKLMYKNAEFARRKFMFTKTSTGTCHWRVRKDLAQHRLHDSNLRSYSSHQLVDAADGFYDDINVRLGLTKQEDQCTNQSWIRINPDLVKWTPSTHFFARGHFNGKLVSKSAIVEVVNSGRPDAPLRVLSFDLECHAGTWESSAIKGAAGKSLMPKTTKAKAKASGESSGVGGEGVDGGVDGGGGAGGKGSESVPLDENGVPMLRRFTAPGHSLDPIIQCGITECTDRYDANNWRRTVLCLGPTGKSSIPGVVHKCFKTEGELLLAMVKHIQGIADDSGSSICDILTGYNIIGYDIRYIFIRAALMELCATETFEELHRIWDGLKQKIEYFKANRDFQNGTTKRAIAIRTKLCQMFGIVVRKPKNPPKVYRLPQKYLVFGEVPEFDRATYDRFRKMCDDAGGPDKLEEFFYMGTFPCRRIKYVDRVYNTNAVGQVELRYLDDTGFATQCGWLALIKSPHSLKQYTLKFAAQHFFPDDEELQKADMPYKEIFKRRDEQMDAIAGMEAAEQLKADPAVASMSYEETEAAWKEAKAKILEAERRMAEVADYCSQDADLPVKILNKIQTLKELREKSRIFRTPMRVLSFCGMQRIVDGIFGAYFATHNIVRNVFFSEKYAYPGAFVLAAKWGLFTTPVGTLDFASLYPSIIRGHNICPTTIPGLGDHSSSYKNESGRGAKRNGDTGWRKKAGSPQAPQDVKLPPGIRYIEVDTTEGIDPADYKEGVESHVYKIIQNFEGVVPAVLKTVLDARARIRKVEMKDVGKKIGAVEAEKKKAQEAAQAAQVAAQAAKAAETTETIEAIVDACNSATDEDFEAIIERCNLEIRSLQGDMASLDGRQLAMKIAANSIYGYFGVESGSCPCTAVAALTTALGRRALMWTQKCMETVVCMRRTGSSQAEAEAAADQYRDLVSGANGMQIDAAAALVQMQVAMHRAGTEAGIAHAVSKQLQVVNRRKDNLWHYDPDAKMFSETAFATVKHLTKTLNAEDSDFGVVLRKLNRRVTQSVDALVHAGLGMDCILQFGRTMCTAILDRAATPDAGQRAGELFALMWQIQTGDNPVDTSGGGGSGGGGGGSAAAAQSGGSSLDLDADLARAVVELEKLLEDTAPIVVYGDTDSVMVNLGHLNRHQARPEFEWLAEVVATDILFKDYDTLVLEAEDQSDLFMLYKDKKKRYVKIIIKWLKKMEERELTAAEVAAMRAETAAAKAAADAAFSAAVDIMSEEAVASAAADAAFSAAVHTKTVEVWSVKEHKSTEKGIETKRRDQLPVIYNCMKKLLKIALPVATDAEVAAGTAKSAEIADTGPLIRAQLASVVASIANDERPVMDYARTQKMKLDYEVDPPHVVAAKKHNMRVAMGCMDGVIIMSGDRTHTVRLYDPMLGFDTQFVNVAEDPQWAAEHPEECTVDRVYVLNQLQDVVSRVLPYHIDPRDIKNLFGTAVGHVKRQLCCTQNIMDITGNRKTGGHSGNGGGGGGESSSGSKRPTDVYVAPPMLPHMQWGGDMEQWSDRGRHKVQSAAGRTFGGGAAAAAAAIDHRALAKRRLKFVAGERKNTTASVADFAGGSAEDQQKLRAAMKAADARLKQRKEEQKNVRKQKRARKQRAAKAAEGSMLRFLQKMKPGPTTAPKSGRGDSRAVH